MSGAVLEELDLDTCLELLRATSVGRIAFILDGYPVVFPVDYQVVEDAEGFRLLLQTRPGNTIDQVHQRVGFQVDGIDTQRGLGWSVLVRGKVQHLRDLAPEDAPGPPDGRASLPADRDAWLAIHPVMITGRRLRAGDTQWPFDIRGYK